jgi:hypothetical protein
MIKIVKVFAFSFQEIDNGKKNAPKESSNRHNVAKWSLSATTPWTLTLLWLYSAIFRVICWYCVILAFQYLTISAALSQRTFHKSGRCQTK